MRCISISGMARLAKLVGGQSLSLVEKFRQEMLDDLRERGISNGDEYSSEEEVVRWLEHKKNEVLAPSEDEWLFTYERFMGSPSGSDRVSDITPEDISEKIKQFQSRGGYQDEVDDYYLDDENPSWSRERDPYGEDREYEKSLEFMERDIDRAVKYLKVLQEYEALEDLEEEYLGTNT